MVFGATLFRAAAVRVAARVGVRLAGGSLLKTLATKVIPKAARAALPVLTKVAKSQQKFFLGTATRRAATFIGTGVLLESPTIRKAAFKAVKEEPLLVVAPTVVAGKSLGKVFETIKEKGKDVTPKELAAAGGIAGVAAAAVVGGAALLKKKKKDEESALTGTATAPTTAAPAATITKTAPVGEIPTTIPQAEKEKAFKQVMPTIKVSVNPKFNTIIQNA